MYKREYKKLEKNNDGVPTICEKQVEAVFTEGTKADKEGSFYIGYMIGRVSSYCKEKGEKSVMRGFHRLTNSLNMLEMYHAACDDVNVEYKQDLACDAFCHYFAEYIIKEALEDAKQ